MSASITTAAAAQRPTNQLRLVRGGTFVTPSGAVVHADRAWMLTRIAEWRRLTSDGYVVPVITGHDPALTRQAALGDVLDLTMVEVNGTLELVATVAWNAPAIPDQIRTREVRYVSPGFKSFRDDRGIDFDLVLAEISIVAAPHQKRMGATHILMSEAVMDPIPGAVAPTEAAAAPTIESRLASVETAISDISAGFATIQATLGELVAAKVAEEPTAEEPEPTADLAMAEVVKLRAALAEANSARRRAEFAARYPAGQVIELGEPEREALFQLSELAPASYAALTARARAREAAAAGAAGQPPRRSEVQWGIAMGEPAGVPTPAIESDGELLTRLRKETGSAGAALEQFKRLRG